MTLDVFLESAYKPLDGMIDDWMVGLSNKKTGKLLVEHLGEESTVLASIRQTGEHLFRARMLVKELVEAGYTGDSFIPDNIVKDILASLRCYAQHSAMRFFNSFFCVHEVVLACVEQVLPNYFYGLTLPWSDTQYDAVVVFYQGLQVMNNFQRQKGDIDEESETTIIQAMEACIKARPDVAMVHVALGNWCMVINNMADARLRLDKALEIDEETCFGSHYTLANIYENLVPDMITINKLAPKKQRQARMFAEKEAMHLSKYLELAPLEHWHTHRASMMLVGKRVTLAARGEENLETIEGRNPGLCAELHDIFERGLRAHDIFVKCYGREQSDFKTVFKQAAWVINYMHNFNLVDEGKHKPVVSEYICGYPDCTRSEFAVKLSKCSRCMTVRYCTRDCQKKHWKQHKHDCQRLAKDLEEKPKLRKLKLVDVKCARVGD
mmetsp:Transcript_7555/g.10845  ORF Transcript_7555/g.10845 Transcript_7555/m.10845 type:complete len:437 (-) Transcript_7555:47-1357(-)